MLASVLKQNQITLYVKTKLLQTFFFFHEKLATKLQKNTRWSFQMFAPKLEAQLKIHMEVRLVEEG